MTTTGDVLQDTIQLLEGKRSRATAEALRIREDVRLLIEDAEDKEEEAAKIDEVISMMKELKTSKTMQACEHCPHWVEATDRCCHCATVRNPDRCPGLKNGDPHCSCVSNKNGPCCHCQMPSGK